MKSVQFAAKFEYLDEIRDFVGEVARAGGFSDKDVYNIQLATDEAASNIIEHAYENQPNGVLELSCGMRGDMIIIILIDHGESFDPSEIPLPDLKVLFHRIGVPLPAWGNRSPMPPLWPNNVIALLT